MGWMMFRGHQPQDDRRARDQAPAHAPAGGTPGALANPDLAAIWSAIDRLARLVENDHQHRLERIERDLKWVMRLATAVLAAVLGAAAGDYLPK
jgi:hypothetical protein